MKENNKNLCFIILFIVFSVFTIFTGLSTSKTIIKSEDISYLSDGWNYEVDSENLILTASYELENKMLGKSISMYTNDSFVDAYIGKKHLSLGQYIRIL